ncbi:hypothetical protein CCM_08627 [Cordyceps militaris CM01]|uniref:Uncharacterized protein n=1 Tax=Cordyceps militaris (strain CM01) TaxID=983644 RepID=G3JRH9_CORMM|nr:uncharacterized protein CCM_08627 [Cordyceps militaris CM01]EGX88582.1 hypothetical protein CCM_08627 [Cordyceps militaris CM01]
MQRQWLWIFIPFLCGVLTITGACCTNDAAPAYARYRRHWEYLILPVLPGLGLGFAAAAIPAEQALRLQQLQYVLQSMIGFLFIYLFQGKGLVSEHRSSTQAKKAGQAPRDGTSLQLGQSRQRLILEDVNLEHITTGDLESLLTEEGLDVPGVLESSGERLDIPVKAEGGEPRPDTHVVRKTYTGDLCTECTAGADTTEVNVLAVAACTDCPFRSCNTSVETLLTPTSPIREPRNCIEYTAPKILRRLGTTQRLVVPLILLAATLAVASGIIQPAQAQALQNMQHICYWVLDCELVKREIGRILVANAIKLELWIGKIHCVLQDCLPKYDIALALNNNYAVFATAFDAQTYNDSDEANLSKACEILRGSEKKFGSLKTPLESVSKGAYIGIRAGIEILVLARYGASVKPIVQLSRTLESAEEDRRIWDTGAYKVQAWVSSLKTVQQKIDLSPRNYSQQEINCINCINCIKCIQIAGVAILARSITRLLFSVGSALHSWWQDRDRTINDSVVTISDKSQAQLREDKVAGLPDLPSSMID